MYKSVPTDIKKIKLDNALFRLHKKSTGNSSFGMDNTPDLLDGAFGLYSTDNIKKKIGPIKTEYFRISLTRKGSAEFDIGLEKYQPKRNFILFGVPGQIFSLHDFSNDFLAYYMLFTDLFISESFQRLNKKQNFPFLTYSGLQCFELDESTAEEIEAIIFKMDNEIKRNQANSAEMIRLYIQQTLILANRNYGKLLIENPGQSNTLKNLFDSYLKLVSQHFLTIRKVSDYASMLHVSADHLNRAIKACSDKTAHEFINEMLVLEAKSFLLHSLMSVSEIAYTLDFSDPAHFNRFFKKHTDCTPNDFRNQNV